MSYNAKNINHHGTEVDLGIHKQINYSKKNIRLIYINNNGIILELF